MSAPIVRPYRLEDSEACMAAFLSNMPKYFADDEIPLFEEWLKAPVEEYFVVELDGKVVGCGGFAKNQSTDDISMTWGMIHNDYHGQQLGTLLTRHRLERAALVHPGGLMRCETSQHTRDFYARFGFEEKEWLKDGFGPGIDKIRMFFRLEK